MRSYWLVARHEYRRMVLRRGFIALTVAIPLGMALLIGLTVLVVVSGESKLPLGYVDRADILDASRLGARAVDQDRTEIRAYGSEEAALDALRREEIQAFFLLPADYLDTQRSDLYFLEDPPSDDAWRDFDDLVRSSLISPYPDEVQRRLLEGPAITVLDTRSGREFSQEASVNIVLPFVGVFFFFIATMSASGYMLQVVADEKENRTMEVMVTSLTPGQLIGGKALGLMAAALTQLAIYGIAAVVVLAIAVSYITELQSLAVPWTFLGMMALFFIPSYVLMAGIMVAIGSAVTELQQGQQIAGILNLFFMLPIFLLMIIFENPGHPLAVFLSLFPMTSFLTISLRWGLGTVPPWQIGVAWVLLVGSAVLVMWAATRVFRAGMLRYGQPLSLKAAWSAAKGG